LLTQILDSAVKTGYPALQLEARLAAAEIGLRSGNAAAALKELAALQRDAAAQGCRLISHKASKLVAAYR
jgi:hypothetical protein